jgi:hypothetical protein
MCRDILRPGAAGRRTVAIQGPNSALRDGCRAAAGWYTRGEGGVPAETDPDAAPIKLGHKPSSTDW